MAAIATMPSSCEARDTLGKSWAVQVKPAGADPAEYEFVPGLKSASPVEEVTTVDATTIDMGDYTRTASVGKALTITLTGFYHLVGGLPTYHKTQKLLKAATTEVGALAALDLRIWRTDVEDEGWEGTFSGTWQDGGNEPGQLREFTATLTPTCEPKRIMSVLEGAEKTESVELDLVEYRKILQPAGTTPQDP